MMMTNINIIKLSREIFLAMYMSLKITTTYCLDNIIQSDSATCIALSW